MNNKQYTEEGMPIVSRETRESFLGSVEIEARRDYRHIMGESLEKVFNENPEMRELKVDLDNLINDSVDLNEESIRYLEMGLCFGIVAAYEVLRRQQEAYRLKLQFR